MVDNKSITPKATLTVKNIGSGLGGKDVTVGGTSTLKFKQGKANASLAFSDATLKNVKSLRDVVATVDYKAKKGITLNGKYDLGTSKYTAGATWDGSLLKKSATVKVNYSNKDNLVAGEATLGVAKGQKVNTTFNQKQLLTAKYTLSKGDNTLEPSYNFGKKAVAVAVTRKVSSKDSLKLSYDLKSEGAAAEWNHKPFKVVVSSTITKAGTVTRPTVAATFENVYEF